MNSVDELNLLLGIGPQRPQLPVTLRKSGYLPVRALGKGSYGQALLVFHEPRQQYFVVKHLNLAGMTSRQRHDAHNEINILQKLHHPNIVQYVEYYEEHPHLYIVMEYADGGDVYSLLSSAQAARKAGARAYRGLGSAPATAAAANATAGLLSEAQVVSLFVQTTMAVRYMHDRRLLHRDIKSSNIFLTKNHIVKLGDFGISTVLQSTMAMASTMCGTPCYFSPELCQGRPYNNKSDMWALGVLLYELCAGHVPFESTTMKTLMRDIVHKQPPRIPPVYSDELWNLIVQLLHKDPRRRPDAGQVLMAPALMKYVPELIEQLASDPAYAAAAKDNVKTDIHGKSPSADELYLNEVKGGASLSPPPPPPRGTSELRRNNNNNDTNPAHNMSGGSSEAISPSVGKGGKDASPASPSPPPHRGAAPPAASPIAKGSGKQGQESGSISGFSPAIPSAVSSAASGPGVTPPAAKQGQQPPSSTASIAALLARFDAQKQQLAESKQKKHGEQEQQKQQQQQPRNGRAGDGLGVAHLSPGAAAALRQQGLDPEKDSQIFSAGSRPEHVADGRDVTKNLNVNNNNSKNNTNNQSKDASSQGGPRRSFAPPPLPAALRDSTATAAGAKKVGGADRETTGGAAASQVSSNNAEAEGAMRNAGNAVAAGQLGRGAGPVGGSGELGAVLTELSTWRERSLRRQQKHGDGDASTSASLDKPPANNNNSSSSTNVHNRKSQSVNKTEEVGERKTDAHSKGQVLPSPLAEQRGMKSGASEGTTTKAAQRSAETGSPTRSKESSAKDKINSPRSGIGALPKPISTATPSSLSTPSVGQQTNRPSPPPKEQKSFLPSLTPTTTTSPSSQNTPQRPRPPPSPQQQQPQSPQRTNAKAQPKSGSSNAPSSASASTSAAPQSPTAARSGRSASSPHVVSTPAPALAANAASKLPHNDNGEDGDDDEAGSSNAQSFTDAMGTVLDVHALQEAAASSFHNTTGAASSVGFSGTGARHAHQQLLHKSFRGTSEKIDELRGTLKPGTLIPSAGGGGGGGEKRKSDSAAAKASGETVEIKMTPNGSNTHNVGAVTSQSELDDDAADAAADLRFGTACLCGRASTDGGCLSMIYGSFLCTCSVCVRFTGASGGVEWLHLPETEDVTKLFAVNVESSSEPSLLAHPSQQRKGSAGGGGAAAAVALRAHAQSGSPNKPREKQPHTTAATPGNFDNNNNDNNNNGTSLPPGAAAMQDVLSAAGMRAYTHQQIQTTTTSEEDAVGDASLSVQPFAATDEVETYVIYTCTTCGGLIGMLHDGVSGLLLPKASLDEQSLRILSSCAQTVDLDGAEFE